MRSSLAGVLLVSLHAICVHAQFYAWSYPPPSTRDQTRSYNWKIGSQQLLTWESSSRDSTVRIGHINPNAQNNSYDYYINICTTTNYTHNCTWTARDLRMYSNQTPLWYLLVGGASADTPSVEITISSEASTLSNPATNTTSPIPTYASQDLTTATGTAAPSVTIGVSKPSTSGIGYATTNLVATLNYNTNGSSLLQAVSTLSVLGSTVVPLGSVMCTAYLSNPSVYSKVGLTFNASSSLMLSTNTVQVDSIMCRSSVFDNVRLVSTSTTSSGTSTGTSAINTADASSVSSSAGSDGGGLSGGAIAGIVIGSIAALIAALVVAFFVIRSRRRKAAVASKDELWDKPELDGDNANIVNAKTKPAAELAPGEVPEMESSMRVHEAGHGALHEMNASTVHEMPHTVHEIGPSK